MSFDKIILKKVTHIENEWNNEKKEINNNFKDITINNDIFGNRNVVCRNKALKRNF